MKVKEQGTRRSLQKDGLPAKIVRHLEQQGGSTTETYVEIAAALGQDRASVDQAIVRLRARGLVGRRVGHRLSLTGQ